MKKINVDICVCLSSVQTIKVPDDYDPDKLEDYVREQITLPQEALESQGCFEWYVDEFCVQE